jgi:hypothetical protein
MAVSACRAYSACVFLLTEPFSVAALASVEKSWLAFFVLKLKESYL